MPDRLTAEDQLQIHRVLFDYAWACDNGEWSLLRSLFSDDAHLDYVTSGGPAGGPDEVVAWLEESLTQVDLIQHVVSNFQIEGGGDGAAGRAMFFTAVRLPGAAEMLYTGGYYTLELVRSGEQWRLRHLAEDNRWMSTTPPARP